MDIKAFLAFSLLTVTIFALMLSSETSTGVLFGTHAMAALIGYMVGSILGNR